MLELFVVIGLSLGEEVSAMKTMQWDVLGGLLGCCVLRLCGIVAEHSKNAVVAGERARE